ncbi:hypothetical protein [Arthrobacter sp. TMS1-12-1]
MTACSVLRCLATPTTSFVLAPYSDRKVPVCSDHKTSLEAGARWMANPGTSTGALGASEGTADVTIMMGRDLPSEPRVQGISVSPTIGSEIGFSVTLSVETTDGQQPIAFWLSEEQGKLLGSWLTE